jgi:hypothetical protein
MNATSRRAEYCEDIPIYVFLVSGAFALSPATAVGQSKEPPPFRMQLLSGYHSEPSQHCIETRCGNFVTRWGPTVEYDIGASLLACSKTNGL